ncbi:MAG TPA: hypothetical protein VFF52_12335 [Isosphaeraceae bacterium]|nr:hypothetical protein [Isosphaeraceae bacterium]
MADEKQWIVGGFVWALMMALIATGGSVSLLISQLWKTRTVEFQFGTKNLGVVVDAKGNAKGIVEVAGRELTVDHHGHTEKAIPGEFGLLKSSMNSDGSTSFGIAIPILRCDGVVLSIVLKGEVGIGEGLPDSAALSGRLRDCRLTDVQGLLGDVTLSEMLRKPQRTDSPFGVGIPIGRSDRFDFSLIAREEVKGKVRDGKDFPDYVTLSRRLRALQRPDAPGLLGDATLSELLRDRRLRRR